MLVMPLSLMILTELLPWKVHHDFIRNHVDACTDYGHTAVVAGSSFASCASGKDAVAQQIPVARVPGNKSDSGMMTYSLIIVRLSRILYMVFRSVRDYCQGSRTLLCVSCIG